MASREDDIFSDNFLDCAEVESNAHWTMQKDEINQTIVILRNRLWPGYTAYARANTAIYGGLYIGDGVCNCDLPFMI